ncbi:hypothetical protein FRC08_012596 [Ceratobasidium sp. 394]|nr:hypothetical protein FRC08_012596 [Ceratobasidium sp. 394]
MNNPIQSALAEWNSARKLLAETIVSYQAACAALSNACISPLNHTLGRTGMLEAALNIIDSELGHLTEEENRLYNARMTLAKARNRSTTLVHINAFPPEILTRIFALSKTFCIHSKEFRPYDYSCACTYWRQLSINTPALWTHIDIGLDAPEALTQRSLERAGNSVIHVHIQDPGSSVSPSRLEKIKRVQLIAPHINRVRTLDMASDSDSRSFFRSMLNLWLEGSNTTPQRSLSIFQPSDLGWSGTGTDEIRIGLSERTEQALSPLSALHLQNFRFDWNNKIYHGLVDLRLWFYPDEVLISAAQLVGILTASPALQTLKLTGLRIHTPDGEEQPAPIVLPHLSVLNLVHLEDDSLSILLPLITSSAELSVGIGRTRQTHQEILAFFNRSRVTVLYLRCREVLNSDHTPSVFASLFNSLPHLHTFIARKFVITADLGHVQTFYGPSNVTFLGCTVTFEGLKSFVAEHGTQNLRLENCMIPYQTSRREELGSRIRDSLLEVYPALQCSFSDADSTKNLPCRAMFHRVP